MTAKFNLNTSEESLQQFYMQNGFLLIGGFYTDKECDSLAKHMHEMIEDFDLSEHQSIFSTHKQEHSADEYFRTSGDKIRFFLEKDALDENGKLITNKHQAINKVGHALHDLDKTFDQFSRKEGLAKIARAVGLKEPAILQSMYIFKPPKIGGEVSYHQDSTFIYTEPESCVGFWVALEDATTENGCLWAEPGGHLGPLRQRFKYKEEKLVMEELDNTPFGDNAIALEVPKGTLVVLHGRLPHYSCANTSNKSREAYAFHLVDQACKYLDDNWLQRDPSLPLRGFN